MNNRINIILKPISIFIILVLLNSYSCGGVKNGINDTNTSSHKDLMDEKIKDEQAACPNCKEGSRFLYRVDTDKESNIILICEECNALWIDPKDISWTGATSDKLLKSKFEVSDSEVLFEEKSSGWATAREIETSEWSQLAKNNELLIK